MRRALLLVLALLTTALAAPSAAALSPCLADCSCVGFSDPELVERADAILVARVTDVRQVEDGLEADAAVESVVSGDVGSTVTVGTAGSSASCGVRLAKGERYLLLARHQGDTLRVDLCSGTGPAEPGRVAEITVAAAVVAGGGAAREAAG